MINPDAIRRCRERNVRYLDIERKSRVMLLHRYFHHSFFFFFSPFFLSVVYFFQRMNALIKQFSLAKVVRSTQNSRVGPISRPRHPFCGPLAAILNFSVGAALQVVYSMNNKLFSLGPGQNQSFGPKQNTKFGVLSTTHHHQKLLGGF